MAGTPNRKSSGSVEKPPHSIANRFSMRGVIVQLAVLIAVLSGLYYLGANAAANLLDQGVASGFGFLSREAGFAIGETTLLSFSAADSYLRALFVGLLNTVRVSLTAIVVATLLGTLIGLARLSPNWLLAKLSAGYVEGLRNVPLIVQLFFWYTLITESFPIPAEAINPVSGVYLSNRGLALPWLIMSTPATLACLAAAPAMILIVLKLRATSAALRSTYLGLLLAVAIGLIFAVHQLSQIDVPELAGFNFTGGLQLSPEFAALLIGLSLYTAAFIAEIVRAGILAVDRGQFEAAHSLGLNRRQTYRHVIAPQALRLIVPPLTSQYLNCTKNSSLAVAIGYPDLVSIANTTINQTGQAIEGIAIIMAVYLTISLSIAFLMNWYNRYIALRGTSL